MIMRLSSKSRIVGVVRNEPKGIRGSSRDGLAHNLYLGIFIYISYMYTFYIRIYTIYTYIYMHCIYYVYAHTVTMYIGVSRYEQGYKGYNGI